MFQGWSHILKGTNFIAKKETTFAKSFLSKKGHKMESWDKAERGMRDEKSKSESGAKI